MGRKPRLPIDNLLSMQDEEEDFPLDEYVATHQQRLKESMKQAFRRLNQKAHERKQRHDIHTTTGVLVPGTQVLLRKRVLGIECPRRL